MVEVVNPPAGVVPDAASGGARVEVFTAGGGETPVLGRLARVGNRVRWRPLFPLIAGQPYRARAELPGDALELEFEIEPEAREAPRVISIEPAADTVPANLLRVYVQFSEPMREGRMARQVRVLADGEPLDGALVPAERELWSPSRDRLTLLFDPGRTKQGVGPNLQVGAPLQPGTELEVRVEPGWRSEGGGELLEPASRRWRVGPADRERPDPGHWTLEPPDGPTAPLRLTFPEPLDSALLARTLTVHTAAGEPVEGSVRVTGGGTRWGFTPVRAWARGDHRLVVAPELEDLAGNRPGRLFDERLVVDRVGGADAAPVVLPFRVSGR